MKKNSSEGKQLGVGLKQGTSREKGTSGSDMSNKTSESKLELGFGIKQDTSREKGTSGSDMPNRTSESKLELGFGLKQGTSREKGTSGSDISDKISERKQANVGPGQATSREKGNSSSDASNRTSGTKQQPSIGPRQVAPREKGSSETDISVYTSSRDEPLKRKDSKMPLIYKSSDEYFEYSCDPCKTAGDHVEAQGFCKNCEEYLCDTCFRSHSRSKVSSHHTLLDKDALPRKSFKVCDPCKTAGDEIKAVGYCKDCKEYLCDSCYKSHSRSKISRDHVLMDLAKMSEETEHAVTSSIANVNIHKADVYDMKSNEEYTYTRDINVKGDKDEKDCFVTGMALVSSNELALCDSNNNSVKLVDIGKNMLKDVLVLRSEPAGITAISKDQIAVVQQNKYQILIISIPGRLSVVRTLKTDGNCLDVKHINGKLYVSFWKPVKFQILQPTGVVIKTIKPDSEVLKHCTDPCHITVRHDENLIYVSDWETNTVFSLDKDGNMKSIYGGELEYPHDVAISSSGSVYLCNRDQHVMYKMTSDLREAAVILVPGDGLVFPHAMCFNTDKQHLYISSGSLDAKYKNYIKIYKWK